MVVGWVAVSVGIRDEDGPQGSSRHVPCADLTTQAGKILLLRPLVCDEQCVDSLQCIHGLDGDVFGVTGTHADDQDFSHAQPDRKRRWYSGEYRELSMKFSAASARPTSIRAVRSMGCAANVAVISPSVPRNTRASGQLARMTNATGQSAP